KTLTLALVVCVVISLANAHCFFRQIDPDATHCQDELDGSWHAVGSSWISNCMNCTCFSCCSTYAIPWIFPEDDCESVFDNSTCEYIVRRKDNPSVLCPITAAVGK
uniref:Beta-microseminoprotein n=2 Tax=Oryzias melastigma TaxID=30732 RepID=A0A3B3DCJ7_ORYME